MKRIIIAILLMSLFLTACGSSNLGEKTTPVPQTIQLNNEETYAEIQFSLDLYEKTLEDYVDTMDKIDKNFSSYQELYEVLVSIEQDWSATAKKNTAFYEKFCNEEPSPSYKEAWSATKIIIEKLCLAANESANWRTSDYGKELSGDGLLQYCNNHVEEIKQILVGTRDYLSPLNNLKEPSELLLEDVRENIQASSSASNATMGEKNALRKAKEYLNAMSFSYDGLVDQLEFEGFTHEEAVYGASNCGANWKEQAAKKAKDYLDAMAFSRKGLIEQLQFDGFTYEQAVYGVGQNGY